MRYLTHLGVEVVGYSLPAKDQDLYSTSQLIGTIDEMFADIRDFDNLKKFVAKTKPSAIFHLAAQPLVLESYRDPLGTFSTNVMGTANVLEIARLNPNVQAVIVVTTDKVYKNENLGRRFVESDPLLGNDPYSASKVGTENVAIAWRQLCAKDFGPSISIVRSGNVIGGGDLSKDRLFADIIRARISADRLTIRNPKSTRPWQHVLDPLNGYLMTMERALNDSVGAEYNFGPTENSLTVGEVIQTVEKIWPDLAFDLSENSTDFYESKLLDLNSSYAKEVLKWEPRYSQIKAIELTVSWWDKVLNKEASPLESIDFDVKQFIAKKLLS